MICSLCGMPGIARNLCSFHYSRWYSEEKTKGLPRVRTPLPELMDNIKAYLDDGASRSTSEIALVMDLSESRTRAVLETLEARGVLGQTKVTYTTGVKRRSVWRRLDL